MPSQTASDRLPLEELSGNAGTIHPEPIGPLQKQFAVKNTRM